MSERWALLTKVYTGLDVDMLKATLELEGIPVLVKGYQVGMWGSAFQGSMSEGAARDFEAMPYVREAVRLRRWDDQAKVIGWKTPDLTQYQLLLEKLADAG